MVERQSRATNDLGVKEACKNDTVSQNPMQISNQASEDHEEILGRNVPLIGPTTTGKGRKHKQPHLLSDVDDAIRLRVKISV